MSTRGARRRPPRLRCAWCRLPAQLVVTATGSGSGSDAQESCRSVAACADHRARAHAWCAHAGQPATRALPGGWWQTSLDGDDVPLTWRA